MKNTINLEMNTSIRKESAKNLGLHIMSRDINNNEFMFKVKNGVNDDLELNENYEVEVLSVFTNAKSKVVTHAQIIGKFAFWSFDTQYITGDDIVYNYVYIKKGGVPVVSSDANAFYFTVGLSKIDEDAGKIAESYDYNYEKILHEFEVAINLTKDEWIGISKEAKAFVDEIKDKTVDQFVETKMGEELANLEVNYATRLTGLETKDNQLTAQLAQTNKKISYQEKETYLFSAFQKRLNENKTAVIVTQGTSMTYGQDLHSDDIRPASDVLADNSAAHTSKRAGVTYPEKLQSNLRTIYGAGVTVINKGFSGDWAERSFNQWNKDSGADLAILEMGTNDSDYGATWVPANVRGNIEKYLIDMRRIIERYLDWGTAVMLITSPRLLNQENFSASASRQTESFRNAITQLSLEYNIPVVDSEELFDGLNNTHYSDAVHLNTKGYSTLADRLTGALVGYWHSIPEIKSGDSIGTRPSRDNFVMSSTILTSTVSGFGPEENIPGQGLVANLQTNGWLQYSFSTKEENLILIPSLWLSSASAEITLDFGSEQGTANQLSSINETNPQGFKPPSTVVVELSSITSAAYDGTINIDTPSRFIHITNKGLHTLRVKKNGAGSFYFNGFVVMSYKDFTEVYNKVIVKSPNGTQYTLTVSDTGTLTAVKV